MSSKLRDLCETKRCGMQKLFRAIPRDNGPPGKTKHT